MNDKKNSELGISDIIYRLFWYFIFLLVPYLFISFLNWDILWISHKIGTRIIYGGYVIICFVPCVMLGVWTPKGMKDVGGTI